MPPIVVSRGPTEAYRARREIGRLIDRATAKLALGYDPTDPTQRAALHLARAFTALKRARFKAVRTAIVRSLDAIAEAEEQHRARWSRSMLAAWLDPADRRLAAPTRAELEVGIRRIMRSLGIDEWTWERPDLAVLAAVERRVTEAATAAAMPKRSRKRREQAPWAGPTTTRVDDAPE